MSQSIGKILDDFKSEKISKQEAVTKLQRNRNKHTQAEVERARIELVEDILDAKKPLNMLEGRDMYETEVVEVDDIYTPDTLPTLKKKGE